jgi:Tol biopolymer transport system component
MKLLNTFLIATSLLSVAVFSGCQKQPKKTLAPTPKAQPKVKPKPINSVSVTGSAEALKRLTVGGPHEKVLSLSPDKKWLLIETYKNKSSNHIIQKMKLSNNIKMLLTPDSSSSRYGVWHPNQKSFIFSTDRMRNSSIVQSMGINGGSGVRFITKSSLGQAKYPDITSDAKKIVFSVDGNLAMVNPNGMDLIMFGAGYRPKFSPDNKQILFIQKVGDYRHIYTMRTDGQEIFQLTSDQARDYGANWSPNGKKIAFVSDRVGGHRHLFIMNNDGSNIIQLTDGAFNINSIEWGDDGYIYFSADAGGNEDVWRLKPKV